MVDVLSAQKLKVRKYRVNLVNRKVTFGTASKTVENRYKQVVTDPMRILARNMQLVR